MCVSFIECRLQYMADLQTGQVPDIAPFSQMFAFIMFKHSGHRIFFVTFFSLSKAYQPPFALIMKFG